MMLSLILLPGFARSLTITHVDLHPPGAESSQAVATVADQQVGRIDGRAALWHGTPESAVLLGGPGSIAFDTSGSRQVGYYFTAQRIEGGVWMGTPDSWTRLPHSDSGYYDSDYHGSYYYRFRTGPRAISGDLVGGWDFSYVGSALLWDLAAGTVTDLCPPGVDGAGIDDVHGNQQVGWYRDLYSAFMSFGAALWHGTAESFVNLHPEGANYSKAVATSGGSQAGMVRFGTQLRATLWNGTAESLVDLHPAGAESSQIHDVKDDWQTGEARFEGSNQAGLWRGTAESFVNLHSSLPAGIYSSSSAVRMWSDRRTLKVAGSATWAATGKLHALLWIISLPDTEAPVILDAAATPDVLWPPNGRMHQINVNAWVADDSGAAAWRVVAVECNEAGPPADMRVLNDHTVSLRAARSGRGNGRVYTVWLQAEDAAGNVSERYPVQVTVPHDRERM